MASPEATFTFTDARDGVRIRIDTTPPLEADHLFGVVENGLINSKATHDRVRGLAMVTLDLLCEEIAESRITTPIIIEYGGEETRPRPHPDHEGIEKHMDAFGPAMPIT